VESNVTIAVPNDSEKTSSFCDMMMVVMSKSGGIASKISSVEFRPSDYSAVPPGTSTL
jgi:hypothetical protein